MNVSVIINGKKRNNSIEIQEFLNAVSEDVKKNDDPCDIISFSDFWDQKHCANDLEFDQRCFLGDVTQLEICNQISYYKEITSYKKRFLPVVRIFKRMIRKSVAFLFLPLVAEQNNVNANISRIMTNFRGYVNADCQKNSSRQKLYERNGIKNAGTDFYAKSAY